SVICFSLVGVTAFGLNQMIKKQPDLTGKFIQNMVVSAVEPDNETLASQDYTVLVNTEHPLQKEYVPRNLVTVSYTEEKLTEVAAKQMSAMIRELEKEGYTILPLSGYRSYDRQQTLFDRKVFELMQADKSLTKEKAEKKAAEFIELPGTSEHQTGLAMDVALRDDEEDPPMEETPEGKWLIDNAYRYGFIVRYPKTEDVKKDVSYEPWHLRYVGTELAEQLQKSGERLEEYKEKILS
ncbi:MAG: M15 family metallopeptidase, partial [Anaerovorax sp.]|nr:M15 family metallopeptidase [Anaerovorax sp.]